MTTPNLSELADIGAKAALNALPSEYTMAISSRSSHYEKEAPAREAFAKAVLDAVGYKLPVDPERESFDAWVAEQGDGFMPCDSADKAFFVWKAGRDELRKQSGPTVGIDKDAPDKPETGPPWIEWKGGKCPIPDTVKRWEYRDRDGYECSDPTYLPSEYPRKWEHDCTSCNHITAYRVLDWGTAKQPATFEAHGHTWFKHTPGDPCPVDGEKVVGVFLSTDECSGFRQRFKLAKEWYWGVENEEHYPIIGWRHA